MKKVDYRRTLHNLLLKALFTAVLWVSCGLAARAAAQGLTPAGVKIQNRAAAVYTVDGQSYRAESNQVETEVKALLGFAIKTDAARASPDTVLVSPGTEALLPFTLTNTGNAPDSYALSLNIDPASTLSYRAIAIYLDRNGNGLLDAGETSITSTDAVAANETISLLVILDVRRSAAAGQFALFTLSGKSNTDNTLIDDNNWRKVTAASGAALSLLKSAAASAKPGDPLLYTLRVSNTGNADSVAAKFNDVDLDGDPSTFEAANGLFISDPIPSGLHITGTPAVDFPSPLGGAATFLYGYANGWSTSGNVVGWGGTTAVTKVGMFLAGSLAKGQTIDFVWRAVLNSTHASRQLVNRAELSWADSAGPRTSFSNTVGTKVIITAGWRLGPRKDPAGGGKGDYLTPSLTKGPHRIHYAADISTAGFVPDSSSTVTRVFFWNTIKNTGNGTDSAVLSFDWGDNPLPGVVLRLYDEDGVTPRALNSRALATPLGEIGPLAPGDSYTFGVEVLVPIGTASDALPHDLRLTVVSKADNVSSDSTTNRLRFAANPWSPFLKTVSPSPDVVPGKTLRYSISFGNAGAADISNASLFDVLPLSLQTPFNISDTTVTGSVGGNPSTIALSYTYTPDGSGNSRGKIAWIFPTIPRGFVGSVSFEATVDSALPDGISISNSASITAAGMPTAVSNAVKSMVIRDNRLVVDKKADKLSASLNGLIQYTVVVSNVSPTIVISSPVTVSDILPEGFNYVQGSSSLDGAPCADPTISKNRRTLSWSDIGALAASSKKTLRYSVRAGPSASAGVKTNSASAQGTLPSGTRVSSNVSSAKVTFLENLAMDSQTIIGRVFYDLNDNRVVDEGEPGLPGARVYLENGTYTITDSEGKYHFEDIRAGPHVIKLDRASLPKGVEPAAGIRFGNLDDPDSIFVNLLQGELYKANFRVAHKTPEVSALDLAAVAKNLPDKTIHLEKEVCTGLSYTIIPAETSIKDNIVKVDIDKALAGPLKDAYLVIAGTEGVDMESIRVDGQFPEAVFPFEGLLWIRFKITDNAFDTEGYDKNSLNTNLPAFARGPGVSVSYLVRREFTPVHYVVGLDAQNSIAVISQEDKGGSKGLESLAAKEFALSAIAGHYRVIQPNAADASENQTAKEAMRVFGIVSPQNDETYWTRDKITVAARFPLGAEPLLTANGIEMPEESVGKKVMDKAHGIGQYDFVGVPLLPGTNTLVFSWRGLDGSIQKDSVEVILASEIVSVKTEFTPKLLFADGKTEPEISLNPVDREGVPLPEGSFVTLTLDKGRFIGADENPQREGFQVRVRGGQATVKVSTSREAETRELGIIAGNYATSVKLEFLPYLRDWIVAGYGEISALYTINKTDQYGQGASAPDGLSFAGKAGAFAKGTIFGCYLLTLSYNSHPPLAKDKLFQQLNPDKNYPVYGDASVQSYDAETSDGKYVKIEKGNSYAMYGDFHTAFQDTELTAYNRSFTGAKLNLDGCWYELKGFWTLSGQSLVKDEIRGMGISGYYYTSRQNIVENSDKLRLEIRSAANPALTLESRQLSRYSDYWINYSDGSIMLREPAQASDPAGNPVYLVVSYEVNEAEAKNNIFGLRPKLKLFGGALELGGTAVLEQASLHDNWLYGTDATLKLGKYLTAGGELAWSDVYDSGALAARQGSAQKLSFKVDTKKHFTAVARYYNTDADFRNPNMSSFVGALREYSIAMSLKPWETATLSFDVLHKENLATGDIETGAGLQGKLRLGGFMDALLGLRYVDLDASFKQNALLGKIGTSVDIQKRLTLNAFVEHVLWGDHLPAAGFSSTPNLFDRLTSTSANASPLGAGYLETGSPATPMGYPDRIFLGAEYKLLQEVFLIAGHEWMGGKDSLAGRTVFGVQSRLFKDTYAYANYGMEDSVDTPRNIASFGIKNRIAFTDKLSANFGVEALYVVQGASNGNFVAPTASLLYLSDLAKHSLRLEARFAEADNRYLFDAATTQKLGLFFTWILKDTFNYTDLRNGKYEYLNNLLFGLAWRPTLNDIFNMVGKISYADKQDSAGKRAAKVIGSVETHWQVAPPLTANFKYAFKWLYDFDQGLESASFRDLYAIRVLYDVIENVNFGFHLGIMPFWGSLDFDYYAGVELGYRLVKNLYASAGWNYKGLADRDIVENSYNSMGFFLSLRYKFDEGTFGLGK